MNTFIIPADVAAKLREIDEAMQGMATRLEKLHRVYGDGEADQVHDDGSVWEWQVSIDHSEVERLIANLRTAAAFAAWLSKFTLPNGEGQQ